MRAVMCRNALYMVLKWQLVCAWMRFICYYKMSAFMFLNALYMTLLKWEMIPFWMRFIWYWNESWYESECALYDIIKVKKFMCLNTLYILLLKWELVCVSEWALYDVIKMRLPMWQFAIFLYYWNDSWYVSEWSL